MTWYDDDGGGWGWGWGWGGGLFMAVFVVLFWALVIAGIVAIVRYKCTDRQGDFTAHQLTTQVESTTREQRLAIPTYVDLVPHVDKSPMPGLAAARAILAMWKDPEKARHLPDVIYRWKARGEPKPVNRRGWSRYPGDVLDVERETRERAHRTHDA